MTQQLVLDVAPTFIPTLQNFISGSNQEVLDALRALLAGERRERFLYLFGEHGSGKTHLLRGACAARADAVFYSGRDTTQLPREANCLIAIDDVDMLGPAAQEDLFHLFNAVRASDAVAHAARGIEAPLESDAARLSGATAGGANTDPARLHGAKTDPARLSGALLLLSATTPPGNLTLRADVATRLASTLAYALQPLSETDKTQALRQHAQQRGFALSDEVIEFLLRHWRRDLPSLMSALDQLDAHSLATHRPITVPLLKQAIGL